ncbi:DNA recombination protein RmuC [Candidatus Peregrinibacteria bacterium]|nr:DNA recombination protein RmuC [Candidatus Peregrinibacteria bacterium]
MEIILIILILLLIAIVVWNTINSRQPKDLGVRLDHVSRSVTENLNEVTKNLLSQLNEVTKQVNERLKENTQMTDRTHRSIGERLDNAAKVVNSVTSRLAKMEEANQRIYEVGKDIASLQEILRAPKLRGILGELFLGDLLTQILPREHFDLQYSFKNGTIVDAVIHFPNKLLVPVDAKFPLENFKKIMGEKDETSQKKAKKAFQSDVKKHIESIASKYIIQEEGTFDFALMYIPAENVYYETAVKQDDESELCQYAISKKVIPVSPNTFYIYLQAILMGFKGLQIEKNTKEILHYLNNLKTAFDKFEGEFELLGTHLNRAKNTYDSSEKRLINLNDKLEKIEKIDEIDEPKRLLTT